jgi:hypothetical protein
MKDQQSLKIDYIITTTDRRKPELISKFMKMKNMTAGAFKDSLRLQQPPGELSAHETALWWAGKGDWNKAHDIVQDLHDQLASRIHAFLHRQEGDISNAGYWYNKAHTSMPSIPPDQEWEDLVRGLTYS